MRTTTKAIIGLSILGIWAYTKIDKYKSVMESLVFSVKKIKNIHASFTNPYVDVDIDLLITNPSNMSIDISTGGMAIIKKIEFYNRQTNKLIGSTNTEITEINLNANSTITITDIRARIYIVGGLLNNLDFFNSESLEKNLKIVSTVAAFGREYQIITQNKFDVGITQSN